MTATETLESSPTPVDTSRDWIPYVAPMVAFLVLTQFEGQLPLVDGQTHPTYYPLLYGIKLVIVAITAWLSRSAWADLQTRICPRETGVAILLGLFVAIQWVGLDGWYPTLEKMMESVGFAKAAGSRSAFDPSVYSTAGKFAYLLMRFTGLVIIVPVIEELFWRSFLWRWLIDPDFKKIPIGKASTIAVGATSGLFALAHPEWLVALITGLVWAWLVWKTKSIRACVISHMVANLALGLYVVATNDWKYL